MRIKVLAFATARDAIGGREIEVEVGDGATVADLRRLLEADYPALEPIWERLAVAVDGKLSAANSSLSDGAEVALLPPVSGGAGVPEPPIALIHEAIDVERVVEQTAHPSCGACLVFEGRVRDSRNGRRVTGLFYDGYAPMAHSALERIRSELGDTHPGLRLAIVHRLGDVPVREASVAIVAAAPHRVAAFEACRETLERLKHEVPIWKREHYDDGSVEWREEEKLR